MLLDEIPCSLRFKEGRSATGEKQDPPTPPGAGFHYPRRQTDVLGSLHTPGCTAQPFPTALYTLLEPARGKCCDSFSNSLQPHLHSAKQA